MPRPNPLEVARENTEAVCREAAWRLRDACQGGNVNAVELAWFAYCQATGKPLDPIREAHRDGNLEGMAAAIDAAYGARPGVTNDPGGNLNDLKGGATNGSDNDNEDDVSAVEAGKTVDHSGGDRARA